MAQLIGGAGISLPPPQALYPQPIYAGPYVAPTNKVSLTAAGVLLIPPGSWIVGGGTVSAVQYLDPVTQQWTNQTTLGSAFVTKVRSDGVNWRVANLSGAAYAATVTAAGSGYVQATTTVTASAGNSTWVAVVGGALGTFTIPSGGGGSGYSKPPLVFIPPPPYPGVAATATAALTAGVVSSVTIRTAGAGYLTAPPVVIVPDFSDPNYINGTIVNASGITVALTGGGTLTAVLLTNFGQSLSAGPTLTVSGAGSSATAATTPVSGSWVAPANDVITMQPDVSN